MRTWLAAIKIQPAMFSLNALHLARSGAGSYRWIAAP